MFFGWMFLQSIRKTRNAAQFNNPSQRSYICLHLQIEIDFKYWYTARSPSYHPNFVIIWGLFKMIFRRKVFGLHVEGIWIKCLSFSSFFNNPDRWNINTFKQLWYIRMINHNKIVFKNLQTFFMKTFLKLWLLFKWTDEIIGTHWFVKATVQGW